ncbi:NodT family efflux transporter outer membrane factor (OMF) lipoprotein [Sphingomonas vulcanisoli]|uniref:NodT family efflux transporter outer membrane factor (OMF) lipoprotein n=1 Tax=Sphingomonas vulcanisoli TaxID=1658060 RepID=A0ABX0TTU7_9SPHN|nr:efflux transporter outer membrane subunit [Sphingomonas vulcanisoli]NIJ08941.1 NodT family efflux transporter outer membrane factor (OMF) lipoprotein [Sphingomonas vulcanisoli]
MRQRSLLSGAAMLLLAGCAGVPHGDPQLARVAPASLGLAAETPAISANWWSAFGDPQLDRLIETGLADNPSLQGALARVRVADAQLGAARAQLDPQVTGIGTVQESHLGDHFIGEGGWSTIGLVTGSLSWNLDLFGRLHASVDRARGNAAAADLDAAGARLMLASSIAQAYVGLAQAEQQIRVANDFAATRQQALGFVQTRIRDQLASQFDLRTAQTLLAEAQQSQVRALRQRDLLVHALAALVGRGADFYPQVTAPTLALNAAPPVPQLLPADLLGRRPDLLAAQARIDASVANRRVARAAFYPNIDISAFAGIASMGLSHLVSAGSAMGGGGPAITLPIFDGGKLRAQYRGATADLDRAIADYNDAVLAAVRDSADAITNVRSADADLATQEKVVAGLRDTVRLNGVRTRTGLGTQLDAIESGFRLLEAEQQLVGLQADTLSRRIQLITALGGGFAPAPVTTAAAPASDKRS